MKFCPYCHRWNTGLPLRCRFCGRTWGARLCSTGHPNPPDANFCGECGRAELSEPSGRLPLVLRMSRLLKPLCVGLLVLAATAVFWGIADQGIGTIIPSFILPLALLWAVLFYLSKLPEINIIRFVLRTIRGTRRNR